VNGKNYNHDKTITEGFFAKHETLKKMFREKGRKKKKNTREVIFVQLSCSTEAELDITSRK